jgi:hypothetical protein
MYPCVLNSIAVLKFGRMEAKILFCDDILDARPQPIKLIQMLRK